MKTLFIFLIGVLYRVGGSDKMTCFPKGIKKKPARVFIIPVLMAVYMSITFHSFWYLFMIGTMQALRIGDGIPGINPNDPKQIYDKGSLFGRLLKLPWLTSAVVQGIYALSTYSIKFILIHNFDNLMLYILINACTAGIIKYLDVANLKYGDIITEVSRGSALASIILI
jgi:hypothetical protein